MMADHYHGCDDSEVDFARYVLEEYHSNPIPDNWLCYFDYEAFARDLFINDFCSVEVDGSADDHDAFYVFVHSRASFI